MTKTTALFLERTGGGGKGQRFRNGRKEDSLGPSPAQSERFTFNLDRVWVNPRGQAVFSRALLGRAAHPAGVYPAQAG